MPNLWGSAGGNGFMSDPERRAGLSGTLMGLAQGLLSQGPGESWGQALGRGFGQAGALSQQYQEDYRDKETRKRQEAFRDELTRAINDPNTDPETAMAYKAMLVGNEPGQNLGASMALAQIAAQGRMQQTGITSTEGMHGLGIRSREGMQQTAITAAAAGQERGFGHGVLMQGTAADISSRLMGERYGQQRGLAELGANLEGNLMGERFDYANAAADLAVPRDVERAYLLGMDQEEFARRSREHTADLGEERAVNDYLRNRDLLGEDQAHQEYMFGLATEAEINRMNARQPLTLEQITRSANLTDRNRSRSAKDDWRYRKDFTDFEYGLREVLSQFNFEQTSEFEMERLGKANEYAQANMQLAADLDVASRMPAQQRHQAIVETFRARYNDESLSPALREEAYRVSNLPPAQLAQYVVQSQSIQANMQSAAAARAARQQDTATNRAAQQQGRWNQWGAQQQYKQGQREEDPVYQNQQWLNSYIQQFPEDQRYEALMKMTAQQGLTTRSIWGANSGGGGGRPQYQGQ